jgi:uncharacterized protein YggL (DUF469 family)
MKKRLRKKLELREFQRTGFAVGLHLTFPNDDTESSYPFWRKLTTFVEANDLYVEGAINDFSIFTNYNKIPIPSIKESDRYVIRDWLRQQPEVRSFRIGPPTINWHPFFH